MSSWVRWKLLFVGTKRLDWVRNVRLLGTKRPQAGYETSWVRNVFGTKRLGMGTKRLGYETSGNRLNWSCVLESVFRESYTKYFVQLFLIPFLCFFIFQITELYFVCFHLSVIMLILRAFWKELFSAKLFYCQWDPGR